MNPDSILSYESQLVRAHDPEANRENITQAYKVLIQAQKTNDNNALVVAADWITEAAQRIKLAAKIRSRTESIEKYANQ